MAYDYLILGAGLAGLSLADVLIHHRHSVAVIDTRGIAAGASGTPVGMVNPATGRRGKKVTQVEQALPSLYDALQSAVSFSEEKFFVQKGVLRPAQDAEMAEEMHKRYRKTDWPSGWCYWLTEKEIKQFHGGVHCVDGGLWLPVGMAVDVGQYLNALARKFESAGGRLFIRPSYTLHQSRTSPWLVDTDRGEKMKADNVILACGHHTADLPYWSDLPFSRVKGQVAEFQVKQELAFDHSISAKGYIAHIDSRRLTVGSTYEHNYNSEKPDHEGLRKLKQKIYRLLPEIKGELKLERQWAGIRLSTRDHNPVVGRHPGEANMYILTGLGSKGLLHSRFLAERLYEYIQNGVSLPAFAALDRYQN